MSLQLSPDQIRAVLANLTMPEKTELLRLLQARQQIEDEAPRDDRPSIAETFATIRDEYAARSSDPTAYAEADTMHAAAVQRISARLAKERPRTEAPPSLNALWGEFQEVTQLARDAGTPPPDEVVRPPEPERPPQDDPLDSMKRASVCRTRHGSIDLDDVLAATEERRSEERAERAAIAEQVPEDKLAPYRGTAPPLQPPSYSDS
jgi:hypothetical protein